MPRISVILPVYNAANFLERAIASINIQKLRDFEVIAINDGSIDNSGEILDRCAQIDPRIRVFHQNNSGSLGAVLNKAVTLARGEYLARHDADDASTPIRLQSQFEYLEQNPNTGMCGTWTWIMDAKYGPLTSYEPPDNHTTLMNFMEKGYNPFVHGSVMFRRELFEKLGGYRWAISQDYDLWLRFSEKARIGMCQIHGYYFWKTAGGITTGFNMHQNSLTKLAVRLHKERVRNGVETSNWESEYKAILANKYTESSPEGREETMHYMRGLHLLQLGRWRDFRTEMQLAASKTGPYTQKATRNLRLSWIAPLLALTYRLSKLNEPARYSKFLKLGTPVPDFLLSQPPNCHENAPL